MFFNFLNAALIFTVYLKERFLILFFNKAVIEAVMLK